MNRVTIINGLLAAGGFRSYLEIGVKAGSTFLKIRTSDKIAVDPDFVIDWKYKVWMTLKNPANALAKYYQMTSDDFFDQHARRLFSGHKLDICLVDGMHEYAYALRDVNNALKYLDTEGVIFLHDCNPATPAAAVSFKEWRERKYSGVWNGDVWKVIVHLRQYPEILDAFVIDTDYGIGVVRLKKNQALDLAPDPGIEALSYSYLSQDRDSVLHLTNTATAQEYLNKLDRRVRK